MWIWYSLFLLLSQMLVQSARASLIHVKRAFLRVGWRLVQLNQGVALFDPYQAALWFGW
jgi:hypothetical protein